MRLIKLFFLFFLISSDVSAIEIEKQINTIKQDFNIIYNAWNRGIHDSKHYK